MSAVDPTPPAGQYGVDDVRRRLREELDDEPPLTELYRVATTRRMNARRSLVAGMPRHISPPRARPRLWDAAQIEAWLADHPLRRHQAALEQFGAEARSILAAGGHRIDLEEPIAQARAAGLSWGVLAAALTDIEGAPVTRQALAQRFT